MPEPDQSSPKLLLVEGIDDKHVVWHICNNASASFSAARKDEDMTVTPKDQENTFLISERGNRRQVIDAIRQEVEVPGRQAVGVVIDADADPKSLWQELTNVFSRTNVLLPPVPDPAGTIIPEQPGQPRIGIWIMPDNQSIGELEDFVLKMIPSDDAALLEAQSFIDKISDGGKILPNKADKAKLHAWLSTRREPGRMGAAIGDGDLETSGDLCQDFMKWLQRLFG